MKMDLDYLIRAKSGGANPFQIFESIKQVNSDALCFALKRMPYQTFLRSAYWFSVATVSKSRAGMRCQVCNCPDGIQVHHRDYSNHGREHLNMSDLVVLCENCHGLFHGHNTFAPPRIKLEDEMKSTKFKLPKNFVVPHDPKDVVIPEGDPILLTHDLICACRANGSFTNATLRALGLTKSMMFRGWVSRLIGQTISRENYIAAAEGRFIYKSGRLES